MQGRPRTGCAPGYRTTMRYRSPDHRCSPRQDGNANHRGCWCRLLPRDLPFGASICRESIQRSVAIHLPGIKPRRRKIRNGWRVGIDLWFQAERIILAMNAAILAGHSSVEVIAGIDLDTRLVGPEFENAARGGILNPGGKARLGGGAAAQAEIVVVALPDLNLFIGV